MKKILVLLFFYSFLLVITINMYHVLCISSRILFLKLSILYTRSRVYNNLIKFFSFSKLGLLN